MFIYLRVDNQHSFLMDCRTEIQNTIQDSRKLHVPLSIRLMNPWRSFDCKNQNALSNRTMHLLPLLVCRMPHASPYNIYIDV